MNISTNSNDLEIRVDRRTELLAIIEIISDYGIKYPFLLERYGNKDYVMEIEKQFKKFKNHKVIKLFNYLTSKYDFCFSIPIQLFLQLQDDFSILNIEDEPFKTKLQGDIKVLELLALLPTFAQEIGFNAYYKNNETRYKKFVNTVKSQLVGLDIINFMNNYYGTQDSKKFIVNLIPWRTYGCYGTHNGNELYTNLCCHPKSKNDDDIYPADDQIFNYPSFLVHEFSHSFINPLTDKYSLIEEDNSIFSDIWDKMVELGYRSNKSILNDHIVRAITLRYLLLQKTDISYYNKQLKTDENWGFIYIKDILQSLENYENNRVQYKSIDDFYPLIISSIINAHHKSKK